MTDLVIPMVFPDDPQWLQEHNRSRCNVTAPARHVRFRSWGTEELLVRCVERYMPWVRKIYILLASPSQVREWMSDKSLHPSLHTVFHREFIPADYLPCFTSPTIEMFLHRIPGLSEQFIYGNDDMFPLSPLKEDDFFRDGRPCQHLTTHVYPAKPNIFQKKCLNQLNMIAQPFGKRFTTTWYKNGHSLQPILLSTCLEVWRRHGSEILRNITPTRRTERSYSQYIYPLYQFFAGEYIDHHPRWQYVGPKIPTANIAGIVRDTEAGIVCFNDNEQITDWGRRAEIIKREIERKLKV